MSDDGGRLDQSCIVGFAHPEYRGLVVDHYQMVQLEESGQNNVRRFHGLEDHNLYVRRGILCPWCRLCRKKYGEHLQDGDLVVPKAMLCLSDDEIKKRLRKK